MAQNNCNHAVSSCHNFIQFANLGNSLVLSPQRLLIMYLLCHIWTTVTLFSLASQVPDKLYPEGV